MSSAVDICNLALSHLGVAKEISDLDDGSKEAQACNRFYEKARDEMLRGFVWPFGKKKAAIGLVSSAGDSGHADNNYAYAYRYPSDCLIARRIDSGIRTDYRQARVSFEIMGDEQGSLILTDKEGAVLEYTSTLAQNPARWHADFQMALSFRLASYIAPRVTSGDPFKIGQTAIRFWNASNAKAQANAGNEVQADQDPDGELVLSRY